MFKSAVVLLALSSVLCTFTQAAPQAGQVLGQPQDNFFYPFNEFENSQPQPAGSPSTSGGNSVAAINNLQDSVANQVALVNEAVTSAPALAAAPVLKYGAVWGGPSQGVSGNSVGGGRRFGDRIVDSDVHLPGDDGYYRPNGEVPMKYRYGYEINDNINGNYQQKAEARNGQKVSGKYEYDDGHITRYVQYVADKDGFRIIKEKIGPSKLARAPLTGVAKVTSTFNDDTFSYEVNRADIDNNYRRLGRNKLVAPAPI